MTLYERELIREMEKYNEDLKSEMFMLRNDDTYLFNYYLIDSSRDVKYRLTIKQTGNNKFYYADEIIKQNSNSFIYYKPFGSHYSIIEIETGKEWEIPKKSVCISICNKLNELGVLNEK